MSKSANAPNVTIISSDLKSKCDFIVDSGADVNLIKESNIKNRVKINKFNTIALQGIAPERIKTLGSIDLKIIDNYVEFHLIPDSLAFPQQGILGTDFLEKRKATINYKNRYVLCDDIHIPFVERKTINVKPRTVTPFFAYIANPQITSGYIPPLRCIDGIYFGNAIVNNCRGKAYLPIFNTTEKEYNIEIPIVELQEYDVANEQTNSHRGSNNVCLPVNSLGLETDLNSLYNSTDFTESPSELPKSTEFQEYFPESSESNNRADIIGDLLRLDHLNSEERDYTKLLVKNHSDRFHIPGEKLGSTNATHHSISTINNMPIHTKQYRYPQIHKEEINNQVSDLLHNDIIEYSQSPYNSPLWIVPKKSDSVGNKRWRMVIDYRSLNEKTIGDAYPLPNIVDILDQLGTAKYFTILDLASGFHQIPMSPVDAPKTAFSTPHGHYQFKRMPFGLKNAPATFQRLMDNVLSGLQGNELFVYMDDIVIYARSLQEHEVKFKKLMHRLRNANLKLQPDKCEFLRQEVAYLGHIIGSDGVRPDPGKIKAIKEYPVPKNPKNIKQFLGLVGYYRRFIPNFSKIAKPLTDLLKKNKPFLWEQNQNQAFDELRNILCSEPLLQYPDFSRPFNLTTDASGYAIGGVLSQGPVGRDLPVSYASRILNSAEQNYSTIEKECLAVIHCIKHYRPYLYGRKFTIITDHKPLVWLHSIKDPSSRLWRWRTKLSEYDFDILYKQGKLNSNADALSRNPPLTIALPVYPILNIPESDDSSDESIFSQPVRESLNDNNNSIPAITFPTSSPLPLENSNKEIISPTNTTESPVIIEECQEDEEIDFDNNLINNLETDESSDSDSIDTDLFDSNVIPANVTIPTCHTNLPLFKINETRDALVAKSDNHVIFVRLNGKPFDQGAILYNNANLLPKYMDLTYERARVTSIGSRYLIALPIKFDDRIRIESGNVKACLSSLLDVVTEMSIKSFCISLTDRFDDIPFTYILNQLKKYFYDISVNITICKNVVSNPEPSEREQLIEIYHSSSVGGHKGITKTYNRLRPHFYWKTMKKDIQKFIQKCRDCQIKKLVRIKTKQPMIITDTPGSAFDKISMDIVGPLPTSFKGNSYILTIQDLLTKYSVAVPLKETNALSIADAFTKHFICIYGTPKAILTDQGTNFLSALMRNLTKKFGIKHFKTTAYHPQSNGSLERSHHVLIEYLKTQINKEENWDEYIAMAMFSYNTSVHESTKYSPYELIFGRLPRIPSSITPLEENLDLTYKEYLIDLFNRLHDTQEDARQNLINSKEKSKIYYDKRMNLQNFREGDSVFLLKEPAKGKFSDQYIGPYKVLEILPNNNVKIQFKSNRTRIVHTNKLKLSHIIDPG